MTEPLAHRLARTFCMYSGETYRRPHLCLGPNGCSCWGRLALPAGNALANIVTKEVAAAYEYAARYVSNNRHMGCDVLAADLRLKAKEMMRDEDV